MKISQAFQCAAITLLLEATAPCSNSNLNVSAQTQSQEQLQAQVSNQERSRPTPPDLAAAAKKLGVTEQQLVEALGLPPKPPESSNQNQLPPDPPPRPDFASAAQKLGTTEAKLVEALGLPPKPPESANGNQANQSNQSAQGCMPPPRLDIKGAAQKLNVSEADLVKALNLPEPPPRDR